MLLMCLSHDSSFEWERSIMRYELSDCASVHYLSADVQRSEIFLVRSPLSETAHRAAGRASSMICARSKAHSFGLLSAATAQRKCTQGVPRGLIRYPRGQ